MISDLVLLVEEEAKLIDKLVSIAYEKKDYIIANDIEGIKEITKRENKIVGRIQRLERQRTPLIEDIGKVIQMESEEITLTRLAEILKGEDIADDLTVLINRLHKSLEELNLRNEQNKVLIHHSLDYLDFSMNIIQSTHATGPTVFSADGKPLDDEPGFLDIRN